MKGGNRMDDVAARIREIEAEGGDEEEEGS